ncbi:acetyltransferase [uncultured Lacinutrix sp.]|uniref:acetyltransferase n=1 Tax=uncultured Lacinutrix sp. TaxID=574032 RepID=UPI0026363B6F|nr:acetyltransferase [uncultured Lacinutrix sp.]
MFLYGAGGHARVVIDIILSSTNYKIDGVYDDFILEKFIHNIPIVNVLPEEKKKEAIITVGNNKIRKKIAQSLLVNYITAVHSKAVISKLDVIIGKGTVVMANAVINPNSTIGKHCIINTAAIVEHDCKIEDFVHISPNAALAGNVSVGEGTQVGLGANVIPGVKIGKWCVIGAGSTVIEDVPDFSVVVGSPAKFIKSNK